MKYNEFVGNLQNNKISPFYLFEGTEEYFKKEVINNLKTRFILNNEDFNFQRLGALNHSGRDIVESAYQLPFANKWRLLVVEEADKFGSEEDVKVLLNYLENPVLSTSIVFTAQQLNRNSKFYRFFKKKNVVVFFSALREFEIVGWIKEKVKKERKTIASEAAVELCKRAGEDLFLLQNEIAKLVSFTHPGTSIEKSHIVEFYPEAIKEDIIFDFLRALRRKNVSATLSALNKLFLRGEEPLVIIAMLAREVRILFSLKLAGSTLTVNQACPYVFKGKFSYTRFYLDKAQDYLETARKLTINQLLFIQQKIIATEFSVKRGEGNAELAIQKAVIDILRL